MNPTFLPPLHGLVFIVTLMFLVWVIAVRIHNAGIVDIAWALGFFPMALIAGMESQGDFTRRVLITTMVGVWSLRLGVYLWIRVMGHHPEEDGRYKTLREQFSKHTNLMFLGFFELQAVLLFLLSLPFFIISHNDTGPIHALEWIGVGIWGIAIIGEAVSDYQLHEFRHVAENKGRTCQVGLWRYSRHPNYFFEWMTWIAYFLFALASPWGWVAIYCPALMLFFLLKVTGIPATEAHALKSRGDEYREYQRKTSMFIPWFRKS